MSMFATTRRLSLLPDRALPAFGLLKRGAATDVGFLRRSVLERWCAPEPAATSTIVSSSTRCALKQHHTALLSIFFANCVRAFLKGDKNFGRYFTA